MDKLTYGDAIAVKDVKLDIVRIDNVVPVKWDGINEKFVVTEQKNATHMLVAIYDGEKQKLFTVDKECENKELLIDLL